MQGRITPWCIYDHIKTDEDIKNYLEAALEVSDDEFLRIAVGDVIKVLQIKTKQQKGRQMNLWKIIPHKHIYRLGDYSGKRCRRCGRFRDMDKILSKTAQK